MASPAAAGANGAASSSRGAPLPLPFPFPAAAHFPFRAAVPFLPQHHHPPATSDADEEVEEDESSMDDDSGEEDEPELADGAVLGSQQRRASSAPGIGRAAMNEKNGARDIQEGHQWRQHSHLYNRGTEQYGSNSSGGEEPCTIPREMRVENGYGVIGRREGGPASSYWDLLRAHLSDPLTGVLMDDAMILSCGHSYGNGGMQHIYRMKACGKCGQPITEDTIRPNLALRLAVQAFKHEEDSARTLKRRRERLEQDKCGNDDPSPTEHSRGKGVQFPFSVFDRVIIKGNKRTPERFVGRQAIVTAQCLNGWFVVKTLDNAESVKLQYRSLAKVADGNGSSAMVSSNVQNASWL
ncbi:unnamed protein product [Urochloa decumbens]|uniref:PUB 62/63 C-terminal domain-containing protein n=1 Tax=Urochloa decumbens TaxID=240449 RepID=A0ABC8YHH1_9POAL